MAREGLYVFFFFYTCSSTPVVYSGTRRQAVVDCRRRISGARRTCPLSLATVTATRRHSPTDLFGRKRRRSSLFTVRRITSLLLSYFSPSVRPSLGLSVCPSVSLSDCPSHSRSKTGSRLQMQMMGIPIPWEWGLWGQSPE